MIGLALFVLIAEAYGMIVGFKTGWSGKMNDLPKEIIDSNLRNNVSLKIVSYFKEIAMIALAILVIT